jgi:diacylglycerol kinase (ATP)
MNSRAAVVFNPGSGQSGEELQSEVMAALRGLGDVRAVRPSSEETFAEEVRSGAEGADIVVAGGGDGTLSLVANALEARLSQLTLAVIPLGTGNDFARTLGLPSDPLEAAASLAAATVRAVDIGAVSGSGVRRLFVNGCLGGFPVEANKAIDADLKRKLGPLAFVVGGARGLGDLEPATIVAAGRRITDCIAVGVGNGRTAGGGIEMWPSARPDDGLLDLCALSATSITAAVTLGAKVKTGNHEVAEGTVMELGAEFVVDADPPMEFNVDGELVGLLTPARFAIAGRARFLTIPSAENRAFRGSERTERS